jgi:hypothetical protein
MEVDTRDLVTTKTAAELLGVSKARVDQFARGGKLAPVEIDGVRFFRRSEVLAFAKQPRPEGRPPKEAGEKPAGRAKKGKGKGKGKK